MFNLISSIFIFLTIVMWCALILSFISKTLNMLIIESLEKQNKLIHTRRKKIKKLFKKLLK